MFSWRSFIRTFCYAAIGIAGVFYLFIVLVDPYESVPFSLPLEREPISTNQRFAYPSLARNPAFDSAIIGTSTARLLKPERLNALTGGNWVNLAMNSATAYEQMEMLKLFLRHHPNAKQIVIGIDDAWCRPGEDIQKFTFRSFPPWMYDDHQWNDLLYVFNDKSLENSVRMIEYWTGKREAKYDRTGYRDFTKGFGNYDQKTVLSRLYKGGKPTEIPKASSQILNATSIGAAKPKRYGSHQLIRNVLLTLEKDTRVTILFAPMHAAYLSLGAKNYVSCKNNMLSEIDGINKIRILDRMRIDKLTSSDENYWDPIHFTDAVAQILEREITRK